VHAALCCSLLQEVSERHPLVSLQQGQGDLAVVRNNRAWAPIGA
jgi:hypothetical protein